MNQVVNNRAARRFELQADGGVATLSYTETPSTVDLVHTEVPSALEGRGFGSALARAALEYARDGGKRVIPTCPFVRRYIASHPEWNHITESAQR
jgi:predicted GNAT family acetyltransferase